MVVDDRWIFRYVRRHKYANNFKTNHRPILHLLQAIQIIQLGMENPVRRPSRFPGFIRVWWVKVFSVCAVAECYQRSKKWKPSASFRSNSMKETGDQRGGTSEVSQCTMCHTVFRSSIFLFDMWPYCNTGCWGLNWPYFILANHSAVKWGLWFESSKKANFCF